MVLTQEQLDKIENLCIEIRDLCGRVIQRKRELPISSIDDLTGARDRLRGINNALRW